MLYIFRPEITLRGQDRKECVTKAIAVLSVLGQLEVIESMDADLGDDLVLEQVDPDPEMPLPTELRDRAETWLTDHTVAIEEDGRTLAHMLRFGANMMGFANLTEVELIQSVFDCLEGPSSLALELIPYATKYGITPDWA